MTRLAPETEKSRDQPAHQIAVISGSDKSDKQARVFSFFSTQYGLNQMTSFIPKEDLQMALHPQKIF
jgi:hypothetical protein